MSQTITIKVSDIAIDSATSTAQKTKRQVEEVLNEWIDFASLELSVGHLTDAQIIALCDAELDADQQSELSALLADNREGSLSSNSKTRLDTLMQLYRKGLLRKAAAWKVAVTRGLRSPLN